METRLNEAIAHLAQTFGDAQRLQKRNGELMALNSKLEQQVSDQKSSFASLAKEKDTLDVKHTVLEERLQKAKEDLAAAHERWMNVSDASDGANQAQQAQIQVALLQNENDTLKGELKHYREEGEQFVNTRQKLLAQIEGLKVSTNSPNNLD